MTAVKTVLSKYADFNGRARRSEYWWWTLAVLIVDIVLNIIGIPALNAVFSLAILVPGIAVACRRLHDTGKSGWLQLIALTIIGIIPLIVFLAQDSTPGDNKYGPNPKGVGGFGGDQAWGTPPPPPPPPAG